MLQEKTLQNRTNQSKPYLVSFPQVFLPQTYYPLQSPTYTKQLVRREMHSVPSDTDIAVRAPCYFPQTVFQPLAGFRRATRNGGVGL